MMLWSYFFLLLFRLPYDNLKWREEGNFLSKNVWNENVFFVSTRKKCVLLPSMKFYVGRRFACCWWHQFDFFLLLALFSFFFDYVSTLCSMLVSSGPLLSSAVDKCENRRIKEYKKHEKFVFVISSCVPHSKIGWWFWFDERKWKSSEKNGKILESN